MKIFNVILISAASVFFTSVSSAQINNSDSASTGTAYSRIANDTVATNFITQATLGNLKEINAGKLAVRKGQNASVKSFAARMIKDHTKATADMQKILLSKKFIVAPPSSANVAPDAMLSNANGAKFDTNYISMMMQDHVKTIQLFENAADKVQDQDLKAFAVKTLPILKEHLKMDKAIAKQLNITTADSM